MEAQRVAGRRREHDQAAAEEEGGAGLFGGVRRDDAFPRVCPLRSTPLASPRSHRSPRYYKGTYATTYAKGNGWTRLTRSKPRHRTFGGLYSSM